MSYPNDIPASPPLTDGAAQALLVGANHTAAGIPQGAPLALQHVVDAANETNFRHFLRTLGYAVTDNELAESRIRELAVASHHASTVGGVVTNGALLAAVQDSAQHTATALNNITNNMNLIAGALLVNANNINNINNRFDRLEAQLFNANARVLNARVLQDGTPLRILRKEHEGLLPVNHPMFAAAPPTVVGMQAANINTDLPMPTNPVTTNDIYNLTMLQISDLAYQAGTDFGIDAADVVDVRRQKVLRYFVPN